MKYFFLRVTLALAILFCRPIRAEVKYYGAFTDASPADIHPQGWLAEMLHRQVEGLGKNHAVCGYPYDTCLWAGRIPDNPHPRSEYAKAWWPYEQSGYLVDGLERLGLATGDPTILAEANANIRYILDHPKVDGSLGPDHIGDTNWPHAVVFRALMAAYAAHPDEVIPTALQRHYLTRSEGFGVGRDVCNVEEMLWTYAHTDDARLLTIARRTYDNFNAKHPPSGFDELKGDQKIVEHGVTFNETAKLPAILYLYTGDKSLLDATVNAYHKIDRDHMLASGLHTAEEKLDGQNPWDYTETCDVSDYTWSVGYVLMATGDATWADHIEKAIFNAGLGCITKDFKAHQYFSSPNQVIAIDGICKRYNPNRLTYRPLHDVECCSGNVQRFLPNFALRQWMRTTEGGVVAALYGPSQFVANIGGANITIDEKTEYPFSETIQFIVHTSKPVTFPLVLRVPGWTSSPELLINNKPDASLSALGSFTTLQRTFNDGDTIELRLPMQVRIHPWANGTASIERGPLTYSLKIAEQNLPVKTSNDGFPVMNKRPASPWNYALAVPDASDVKVVATETQGCPWDIGNSPIELKAPARQIENWKLASNDANPGFERKPDLSPETETITLVPYGSTCLRLTVFPTVH
jgi:hypothetical protein